MRFGYFDDKNREYIITTPQTPFPWINYLGNEHFFSLISNTAGGYCFYKDAKLCRILRYRYNNIPIDNGGRYFYIKEQDDIWCAGWKPVKRGLSEYQCRHGLGYTIISGTRNGLNVETLFFVPLGINAEIHKVKLTNTTLKEKDITLFSFVEFCLWNAQDDMTNFRRNLNVGEVEVEGSTIYHKTEYRERRNNYVFYTVNRPIAGFDTDREQFLGLYNGLDNPEVISNGKSKNSVAEGWSPIASQSVSINLKPKESVELVFVLGYIENDPDDKWESPGIINKTKAKELIKTFSTVAAVDEGMAQLHTYWDELLSRYVISTCEEKLNRMVNIWNQYQCRVTFNFSRSASYFESGIGGGMGFRDSNQDIAGFVHQQPNRARQRILDLAATQHLDGGAYYQFQTFTKQGNDEIGTNFNDDSLWLIYGTASYIKETGDWSILDEKVPFDNDPKTSQPLIKHLDVSFYHVVHNIGPHGLPLIGSVDWNDCLKYNSFTSNPDESFKITINKDRKAPESVFVAGMFVGIGKDYITILNKMGRRKDADTAVAYIDSMRESIIKHGWDGEWFLWAYDDNGNKIGSKENPEGSLFIEPQGYCIMGDIGVSEGYAEKALESSRKFLDTLHGLVLTNPPFSKYHRNLGNVSSYPPGYNENSGICCHNNPWIIIAETILGQGDNAFTHYCKIAPAYREEVSEVHRMEPYVYSQMIAGKGAKNHGEAKNSWLTTAAAWNFIAASQWILGIRPDYDGLIIDPCIPKDWNGFTVQRKYRGATYIISVKNPQHVCKGIRSMKVDDAAMEGSIIPVLTDGKEHHVEVIMGERII